MNFCSILMIISNHILGGFDTYSFEHLDLFYEEDFQPHVFSFLDEDEAIIFLEWDSCDETFISFLSFIPLCH
jgi:hypothetical protein